MSIKREGYKMIIEIQRNENEFMTIDLAKIDDDDIAIVWEDGTEEKNVDLPNHIMNDIEDFLNYLEEVENDDEHFRT